jgi:transposase-like protein
MQSTYQKEDKMAHSDPTRLTSVAQAALLDEPDFLRELVQHALQTLLEAEMEAHLGAQRYERTPDRRGYRNGYKPRQLQTRVGTLDLMLPQDRDGTFSTELFGRYQRTEQALVLTLMEMYLQGVSTRKVATITEQLCGTRFSKSQVSALTVHLDERLQAWRERPLTAAAYPYLTVDARYEKVRQAGQVVSEGVLLVSAVRDDGYRELVAVAVAATESEATYQELFRDLKARGLSGVELVTSDDHQGLRQAIARHFQGAGWQRCQVHFSRNLQGLVGRRHRQQVAEDVRTIFACATPPLAWAAVRTIAERWRPTHPGLAERLEEDIEDCLTCLAFPVSHQRRIRTTNGLERVSQELKRRTRVVRIFPNRAACLRLVTALAAEISEEWESGRRYLNMEELLCDRPIVAEHDRPAAD